MPPPNTTTPETYGIAPPGFRLPDSSHVGGVRLQVSDLARSVTYYTQVIGLTLHSAKDGSAVLGSPDGHALVRIQTRRGVRPSRRGALGLFHVAIRLPDREALGRFMAHLSDLHVRAGMADHSVSEALYLWDPDGLGIEVYADRPQRAWRQRDGELVMTTDPLDIGNLLSAGRRESWSSMPSGTTIGHVHLHVGSLDLGERFYHAALGLDKTVWTYPGALFLAAGGYHHHLGINTWSPGPPAKDGEARLLDWELVLPTAEAAEGATTNIRRAGFAVEDAADGWTAPDPWGTRVRIVTAL